MVSGEDLAGGKHRPFIIQRIEAHSGAVIEGGSVDDSLAATNPEVNVALPTINKEVDNALRFYSDRSIVDVVLIQCVRT
jgi:hypothetical protein